MSAYGGKADSLVGDAVRAGFILLSVGCSVSVAASDIGPKVLNIMVVH